MRLDLDFKRKAIRAWVPWTLLALGLALAVEMSLSYRHLAAELAAQEDKRTAGKGWAHKEAKRASAALPQDDQVLHAEIARAVAAMDDLARPWETLFEALETIELEHVALLSIQPDADNRVLTLTGEAKAYADLLTYVARLKDKRIFTSVVLASHELRESDPQRPYLFTTRADWKASP